MSQKMFTKKEIERNPAWHSSMSLPAEYYALTPMEIAEEKKANAQNPERTARRRAKLAAFQAANQERRRTS